MPHIVTCHPWTHLRIATKGITRTVNSDVCMGVIITNKPILAIGPKNMSLHHNPIPHPIPFPIPYDVLITRLALEHGFIIPDDAVVLVQTDMITDTPDTAVPIDKSELVLVHEFHPVTP